MPPPAHLPSAHVPFAVTKCNTWTEKLPALPLSQPPSAAVLDVWWGQLQQLGRSGGIAERSGEAGNAVATPRPHMS